MSKNAYDGKVTIWIKKEDRESWTSIEDKPKWLHDHLNSPVYFSMNPNEPVIKTVKWSTHN